MIQIFNDDCLDRLGKLELGRKVDLVIVDLPYAQTACKWDSLIDLSKMWDELKKICKRDCIFVFFCTTKFGYKLIQSNEKWFRYDLIWEKSRKVGFLSANKMPLRKHEMMYVFADDSSDDLENNRNLGLRAYAEKVKNYINKPIKIIDKAVGNQGVHHFYSFKSTQFGLPTEKTYNILIEKYKLREMPEFREYESLTSEWAKILEPTYNPQKTEGKPYKIKQGSKTKIYWNDENYRKIITINKGDRHPHSILHYPEAPEEQKERKHEMMYVFKEKQGTYNPQKTEGNKIRNWSKTKNINSQSYYRKEGETYRSDFKKESDNGTRHPTSIVAFNNPKKSLHRTQKPTDLIEWLIKSYSNEGDLILDHTMGSGSTGIACLNTGRYFIGIEKDKDIFLTARNRLIQHELTTKCDKTTIQVAP